MKFGPVPIEEAAGKILGHNVARPDGRRLLRKGRELTAADVEALRALGRTTVYVAELEPGDVDEDTAAARLAEAVMGPGLRMTGPSTGRANLYATVRGVVLLDPSRLARFNSFPGITLATLTAHSVVPEGQMVATIKILPYSVPAADVTAAAQVAAGEEKGDDAAHVNSAGNERAKGGSLLRVEALQPRRVGLILSGAPSVRERIVHGFETALRQRLEALGSRIDRLDFVPLEDEAGEVALAEMIQAGLAAGLELIVLAGETAIMDRYDIAPRAVERAGGEVVCYGAPVDPGNLLMLAYAGPVPILGAPGCARSPKANIVDQVLPRLLIGQRLDLADIIALGHGGLLEDVPERPLPRSQVA